MLTAELKDKQVISVTLADGTVVHADLWVDLLQGISQQQHPDIIALSDHMMDSHGAHNRKSGELHEPYGIPYRCLIPKGFTNLLVAGRLAGFSCIAASSCRLSRTMMQHGQAAGTAAYLAITNGNFNHINITELKEKLKI